MPYSGSFWSTIFVTKLSFKYFWMFPPPFFSVWWFYISQLKGYFPQITRITCNKPTGLKVMTQYIRHKILTFYDFFQMISSLLWRECRVIHLFLSSRRYGAQYSGQHQSSTRFVFWVGNDVRSPHFQRRPAVTEAQNKVYTSGNPALYWWVILLALNDPRYSYRKELKVLPISYNIPALDFQLNWKIIMYLIVDSTLLGVVLLWDF